MNNPTSESKPQSLAKATLIKLSVDIHAKSYAVVRQVDNARMQPPQRMDPQKFVPWVGKQRSMAQRVVVCYESGPFGFELARRLLAIGVECIVMAAQQLDERKKRIQTDDWDAMEIASRLDRYLAGNTRALAVVKIPTLEQERKRSEARQRQQLLKTRKQLEAQGRALLVLNGEVTASSNWWHGLWWERGRKLWPEPVVEMLERWRGVLLQIEKQVEALTDKIERSLGEHLPKDMPKLPIGVGALTWVSLSREVLDWARFNNRGEVGSFSGLVASECSSGATRRQGHITKVGNARIRALMVELVWRLVQYQPDYWVVKKWWPHIHPRSKCSPGVRKKAIIAMARQSMVDLWRLATGQTTLEKLGLKLTYCPDLRPVSVKN